MKEEKSHETKCILDFTPRSAGQLLRRVYYIELLTYLMVGGATHNITSTAILCVLEAIKTGSIVMANSSQC